MKIILLENIINLGKFGKQVKVKPGYARNYLIPNKKAISATKKNIENFNIKYDKINNKLKQKKEINKIRINQLKKLNTINIYSKSGIEGKLYGSIGIKDIMKKIILHGINIKKNEIKLINGVIKNIGIHKINISINKNYIIPFNIKVISKNNN